MTTTATTPSLRLAALLRGVNVGGHRKLPMAALRASMLARGFTDVATYLQSGNVVLTTKLALPQATAVIGAAIRADFGFDCVVIVRDRAAMQAVVAAHPFAADEDDLAKLHVLFADAAFDPAAIARIDPSRLGNDRCAAIGRELYLHTPDGLGKTKLTMDVLERAFGGSFTQRNWRSALEITSLLG